MPTRTLIDAGLALAILAAPALAGGQASAPTPKGTQLGTSGEAAIIAHADRLDAIAAKYNMSGAQLAALLGSDDSVRLTESGDVFYVCPKPAVEEPMLGERAVRMDIDPADAFTLNSDPTATKTIYLDFDGHHSHSNAWGHNIQFPAFDRTGDPSTFTTAELNEIIGHWEQVVEDFAPFHVNVTTQDPGLDALRRTGGGDDTWGVRCVHTQATNGFGDGIGGVAFLNSFNDSNDNPVFAFNKGIINGGMTGSHEVGHALGLSHDGLNSQSYHPGTNINHGKTSWGPIMGAPFGRNVVQWSNGDYTGSTTTQNDTAIITNSSNGIDYYPDDHADGIPGATPMTVGDPITGVIETRSDTDSFTFTLDSCASVRIFALPRDPGTNLDVLLLMYDSSGTEIWADNRQNDPWASAITTLDAGTYTIVLEGDAHPAGRYSDYGSLGFYTLTVNNDGDCPCPADMDNDGDTDADDILIFVALFTDGLGFTGDMDGDLDNDADDIAAFVDSFIAGCP